MDMAKGELRPYFNEDAVTIIETDDDGTWCNCTEQIEQQLIIKKLVI